MKNITIGVVDYGMGNLASVVQSLWSLGVRVRIGGTPEELNGAHLLLLPGVGAFPAAMEVLHRRGLASYLKESAVNGLPLIGICLGMQILMSGSHEYGYTEGLGLIPGEAVPFDQQSAHIGWNTIEVTQQELSWAASDGKDFYFNHSYYLKVPEEYQVAITRHRSTFTSVLQRGKVVGLQFHPEKSQSAGKILMKNLINELTHA